MKLAILDSNYTDDSYSGLAATWLRWELQRAGVSESAPELADVLLCTVSSQQGISQLRGALRRVKNKRAKVILGGGGCYAPAVFDQIADVCCVGEGARFMRTLLSDGYEAACQLPEAWLPGDMRTVTPNRDFPWEIPPLNHPDGTSRVFGSRGCRYRCLFCQTGWENDYRVNPEPERLRQQVRWLEAQRRRLAVVTNDGADVGVMLVGQQEFVSVRFANLKRMMPITRERAKSVRIGVEGVSERLRRAVGKPVPNDELVELSYQCLQNGVGVRWFFVAGLPGETDADYDELRSLTAQLKRLPRGVVMMNFHAFIPQPATPLCVLPLEDTYWERFDEFRRWFFHGPGFTRHVQIIAPAQCPGRLTRSIESMAATEDELRRGWFEHDNPNWRVHYLATPEQLRRMASVYQKRVMA